MLHSHHSHRVFGVTVSMKPYHVAAEKQPASRPQHLCAKWRVVSGRILGA